VRNSQGFGLEDLAVLVLDEADRLLEMGFKEEVRLTGLRGGGEARQRGGMGTELCDCGGVVVCLLVG